MSKYEIVAIIISICAFLCSVPGGILAIIDIRARKMRIAVSFERRYCIPTEDNGTYKLNIRYNISNKTSNALTIRKISALYDGKEIEVFKEIYNHSGIFENVAIPANSIQEFPLSFEYDKPIQKAFTLKIHTNSKTIKQKLSLPSDLRYRKENQWN